MKEVIELLRHAENTLQSVRVRAVDMPTEGNAILSAIREIQTAAGILERMQQEAQKAPQAQEHIADDGGQP